MLSDEHRRFLWLEQGLIPALFNFVINGGLAWLLVGELVLLPLWGEPSIGADLLATGFLLPFLTCAIVTVLVRRKVQAGGQAPLEKPDGMLGWLAGQGLWMRSLWLGLIGIAMAALTIWLLTHWQPQGMEGEHFSLFKAAWAAVVAALLTPLIGYLALVVSQKPALATQ